MLNTRKIIINNKEFAETTTTQPETKKILQIETNKIYFNRIIDIPDRYTYKEIDKTSDDLERDKKRLELRNRRSKGGTNYGK